MGKSPKKAKSLFLQALNEKNAEKFLSFYVQHKCKKSSFTYELLLKSLSGNEVSVAWQNIFDLVQTLAPVLLEIDLDTSSSEVSPITATDVLQSAIIFANLTLTEFSNVPLGLLQMAVFLHGILLRLPDKQDNLKNNISLLCEKLWINDVTGKEEVMLNTSIYLLKRTLRAKGTKVDVKRVWQMKDAIHSLISQENEDKDLLLSILKYCTSSSLYLSSNEGIKLIEFLLCFDMSLVEMFHDSIKLHIPSCSLKQSETYGGIYYNAWIKSIKENNEELKEKLELSCIQDFMYHAVHVQRNRPRSLVPLLRKFLAPFHKKKKDFRVLRMLRDLYEPILWRALKNASGSVRANAAQIFFDVFPLEDPDFNVADMETELQRQLLIIQELLLDEYPLVRSISAIGVCLVMSCHWELLPQEMVRTYFKILTEELACDSSSADVRCAVIKGVKAMLTENQLVVPTLKIFLPKLQNLFHDISEKVRISFCQLLLAVKKIRFIKFWEIVPLKHLLARLEEDKPVIARLIVQLLCNSYLPSNKPQEYWLGRCIDLIKTDLYASKVFFMHAPEFVDIQILVKFMLLACRALNVYVQSKNKKKVLNVIAPVEDKENQSCDLSSLDTSFKSDGPIAFDNPKIVRGVIDALTIIYMGTQNELQKAENKILYKELIARFGMHMPALLKYFKNSEIYESVLMLCGLIPPTFVPTLSNTCLSQLKSISPDCQTNDYAILLVCLCNQGKGNDALAVIKEWIEHGLHKGQPPPKVKKSGKTKKSSKDDIPPNPILGVKFLEAVLIQPMCRSSILKHNVSALKEIIDCMKTVQNVIKDSRTTLDDDEEKSFLFRTFSCIARLSVLLQGEKAMDADAFIRNLLSWTSDTFLMTKSEKPKQMRRSRKSISLASAEEETSCWKNLGFMISEQLLTIGSDMVLMGFVKDNTADYVKFIKDIVKSGFGPTLMNLTTLFINQISESAKFLVKDVELRNSNQSLVLDAFDFLVTVLEDENFFQKITESDVTAVKVKLRELLLFQAKQKFNEGNDIRSLIHCLFKSVHRTLLSSVQELLENSVVSVNFPRIALVLLSLITGNDELIKLFIAAVVNLVREMDSLHALVTCFITTHVLEGNKTAHKKLEHEIKSFIQVLEEKFPNSDLDGASAEEKCLFTQAEQQIAMLKEIPQGCAPPPLQCPS